MTDAELIVWLRFWLSLTDADISDADLLIILDGVKAQYPSATDCQLKYYFAVAVLEHFIRASSKGSAGSTGTGAIKKRREKRGNSEVELQYDVGTSGGTQASWDTILEDLKKNPNSIGCTPFPITPDEAGAQGSVIIGGLGSGRFETNTPWRQNLNARFNPKGRRY